MGESNDKIERKKKYLEKHKDPRWQKLRLEVFKRDKWACQECLDSKSPLHVHHMKYVWGNDPWDYPINSLITLCETCHEVESNERKRADQLLIDALRERGFFYHHVLILAEAFHSMEMVQAHDIIGSTLSWILKNPKKLHSLTEEYFKELKKRREARRKGKEVS